ncbi:MAG: hypothetical protein JSV25_12295 [Spirochaetota bacterium]|nr:MAG: hypothetical protein JSV25_12295 [Spirochaetota bacterium]
MAAKHHEVEDVLTKITKKMEKFISKYLRVIIISVTVIIVGLATYFSLDYIFKNQEAKANSAFGKVYLVYEDINNNEDIEEEELNEKLLGLNDEFKAVMDEYPKSSAASKSSFFIGNTFYRVKRYNEAIEYYKKGYNNELKSRRSESRELRFLKLKSLSKSYIALLSLQGEASCYEQLEDYEKAEKLYREIIDHFDESFIIPLIKYNLGQLYEKQDNFEMANREYSQIVTDYEWSSWKDLAEKRLLLIKNFI